MKKLSQIQGYKKALFIHGDIIPSLTFYSLDPSRRLLFSSFQFDLPLALLPPYYD